MLDEKKVDTAIAQLLKNLKAQKKQESINRKQNNSNAATKKPLLKRWFRKFAGLLLWGNTEVRVNRKNVLGDGDATMLRKTRADSIASCPFPAFLAATTTTNLE